MPNYGPKQRWREDIQTGSEPCGLLTQTLRGCYLSVNNGLEQCRREKKSDCEDGQRSTTNWISTPRILPQRCKSRFVIVSCIDQHINLLDLRVEKRLNVATGKTLALQLNIYNATNINVATARTQTSGASYGLTTAIISPRILEMTARLAF